MEVDRLKLTDTVTVSAVVGTSVGLFVGRKVGIAEGKGIGFKVGDGMGGRVSTDEGFSDREGNDVGE